MEKVLTGVSEICDIIPTIARRIDAARQKRAQRNFGNQTNFDRFFDHFAQNFDIFGFGFEFGDFSIIEIPVFLRFDFAVFENQKMPGRKLMDIFENAEFFRHVTESQISVERREINLSA